ncbi:hypothetical protein ALC60_07949, partial [Trachymyrmex zeteki]
RKGGENSLILLINDATERDTRCHGCFSVARCMSLGVDFAEDDIASTNNHFSEVFAGRRGADGPPTMSRSLNSLEGCCGAPMLRAPSQPETSNSPVCLRGKEKEKGQQAYYECDRKGACTGCISTSIR